MLSLLCPSVSRTSATGAPTHPRYVAAPHRPMGSVVPPQGRFRLRAARRAGPPAVPAVVRRQVPEWPCRPAFRQSKVHRAPVWCWPGLSCRVHQSPSFQSGCGGMTMRSAPPCTHASGTPLGTASSTAWSICPCAPRGLFSFNSFIS